MNDADDKIAKNRNMIYYNQMVKNDRNAHTKKNTKTEQKKKKSFTTQTIELKNFALVPEGWENFAYAFYAVVIPYVFGSFFLFFVVAGANFDSFMLLNMDAFFIVWLIGYEITSVIALIWILILYLQYENEETYY